MSHDRDKLNEFASLENVTRKTDFSGDAEIDGLLRDVIETLRTKGKEYTVGSPDRLAHFRGVAADVGIPMEKSWYVFANKHWQAIRSYIKNGGKVFSNETIRGRIMDVIVYMLLFYKISQELEKSHEVP